MAEKTTEELKTAKEGDSESVLLEEIIGMTSKTKLSDASQDELSRNNDDDENDEKPDDDQNLQHPAYIPRVGQFFMHDTREIDERVHCPRSRADRKWKHDLFIESEQAPISDREYARRYGVDREGNRFPKPPHQNIPGMKRKNWASKKFRKVSKRYVRKTNKISIQNVKNGEQTETSGNDVKFDNGDNTQCGNNKEANDRENELETGIDTRKSDEIEKINEKKDGGTWTKMKPRQAGKRYSTQRPIKSAVVNE